MIKSDVTKKQMQQKLHRITVKAGGVAHHYDS